MQISQERPELPRETWQDFFQRLSSEYRDYAVTIEVIDPQLGDQLQAADVSLSDLEYDPKDDVLIIAVESQDRSKQAVLRHLIEQPQTILADQLTDEVRWAIDASDKDGTQTIVTLARRPRLPPPGE